MAIKTFYHVTLKSKLNNIQKNGLNKNLKNVKISKGVNYVMDNIFDAGIFASKMAWETGKNVVIIHLKLDTGKIKPDKNIGAYNSWMEYNYDIPPSAITKITHVDDKFWKSHQKRMKKRFER